MASEHDVEDRLNVFLIFIGKSHVEPPSRVRGIAPMGYATAIVGRHLGVHQWGYGGEKNTEAMVAHGLVRAANVVFLEYDDPIIEVVMPRIGTQRYLKEYVPKWLKKLADGAPGISNDNFETWNTLHTLAAVGNLNVRKPKDNNEKNLTKIVQSAAQAAAKGALIAFMANPSRFSRAGIVVTDEEQESPLPKPG